MFCEGLDGLLAFLLKTQFVAFDVDAWYNECVVYGENGSLQGNLSSEEHSMFTKIGKIRWIVFGLAVLAMGIGFLVHGLSVV